MTSNPPLSTENTASTGAVESTGTKKSPDIMEFFPLETARKSQELGIREIHKAFESGIKIVILEAPVGSGKSAMSITLARYYGGGQSHLITPTKSLQNQYFDDFEDDIVLMKGRNAYPCTIDSSKSRYSQIIKDITNGRVETPKQHEMNCAVAPCRDDTEVYKLCTSSRACPYAVAMEVAQNHPMVIHNLHSFIFQASFGKKFEKRGLLVVDEAHEIEGTVREFVTKKIQLTNPFTKVELDEIKESNKTWTDWESFLLQPKFVPEETDNDRARKKIDPHYSSAKDKYVKSVVNLNSMKQLDKGFAVEINPITRVGTGHITGVVFEFVPTYVGSAVNSMLLDYGDKILLMSGTIYNKDRYCSNLGINPSSAHFIRMGSSFPKEARPIYCIPEYQVNTSHATWNDNFSDLVEKIRTVSSIFHDQKGLIHAPSYATAEQLRNALNDPRYVTHQPGDFQQKLTQFYESTDPLIFISPTCQQGVDFKGDRARFQMILRIPYPSTSSAFMEDKVKNDFPWYMHQSLVVFGQQIGRINRSAGDFGATFLMDERFNRYISRNSSMLPDWVKSAIVWKSSK